MRGGQPDGNRTQTAVKRVRITLAVIGLLALITGCSNDHLALNEDNSYFRQGITLREDEKFDQAIEAFEQCLHHSPDSHEAHLQLALIYEDHKQDYAEALVHYKRYLEAEDDPDDVTVARQWLTRAERKFYRKLDVVYGSPDTVNAPRRAPADTPEKRLMTGGESANAAMKDDDELGSPAATTKAARKTPAGPSSSDRQPRPADVSTASFYVVKHGDTLSKIARDVLGDEKHWQAIYDINRKMLKSPEQLHVGQRLRLPNLDRKRVD